MADTSPFRALDLPTATRVRGPGGAPGPFYWQQRVDYTLRAALDTAASVLTGSGRIHYVNHSPDTLDFVWFQLDQNLAAPSSITRVLNQPPLHFAGGLVFDFTSKGFVGGITIDRFAVGDRALTPTVTGTMMRVDLPAPLAPGAAVDFDAAWHFPIPAYGGGRMGHKGATFYEIAQ